MKNIYSGIIRIIFIGFLLAIFLIFSAFWYFSHGLPSLKKLSVYEPSVLSRVYDDSGKLVAEYSLEKRLFIPINSIPEKVINSFLSAEDKNFFNHPGVDARGVTRAVLNNIENIILNKRLEGASTITQQVAKNFLLTNEVSLRRKIREAILAFRIEKAYTKKRILELYLNEIYLGQGTYGVASASLEYFNKSVKELNYNEAALLAALPKAPSKYNPYKSISLAKIRRDLVLKNLNENGYISNSEYKKLVNEKIKLNKRQIFLIEEAKSYTEEIRRIVKNDYGFEKLYSEGLSISTPLNGRYQISALNALREGIEAYDRRRGWRGPITNKFTNVNWEKKVDNLEIDETLKWDIAEVIEVNKNNSKIKLIKQEKIHNIFFKGLSWTRKENFNQLFNVGDLIFVKRKKDNFQLKQLPLVNGSIVVMNPHSGKVKALVGGYSFVSSEFNRATQAKRQPGSAFKPIVYASALENGYLPNSIILDAPFVSEQGVGLKNWKPENYGKKFYGPSTLRIGIEKSRNLMTVRVAQNLGFKKISDISKNLGVYKKVPELLSVSLGSNETTLLKLTNAYCSFVNGGKKVSPILINRIQDRRGKTIFNSEKRNCDGCKIVSLSSEDTSPPKIIDNKSQVLSEETAYQITSMLQGVVKRGTGKKLNKLNVPIVGKTGTTNDNFDAWFIGSTSDLTIGVYIGYDEPRTLGKYETGAKAALPIFKKFIENALYKEEIKPFKVPKTINFFSIDYTSGKNTEFNAPNSIIEAFKEDKLEQIKSNNLNFGKKRDKLKKFMRFY